MNTSPHTQFSGCGVMCELPRSALKKYRTSTLVRNFLSIQALRGNACHFFVYKKVARSRQKLKAFGGSHAWSNAKTIYFSPFLD